MSSTRKPRGDAVLKNLPDALQDELYQMLRRNTQEKVVEWLKADHGIKTDSGALSRFWEWYHSWSLKPAADFAGSLQKQFEKMPQLKGQAEKIREITQVAFEVKAAQDRDPKLFFALRKMEADTAKGAREDRKLKLLEAKAAQADQGKAVADDKTLTEAEQLQRYRQIFG